MIEIAVAVVIMLLGAGGYQALASVDFKPIIIKLPERKTKIIETKPVKVEDYWQYLVDEMTEHDRTKNKLTKAIEGKSSWYKAFEKAIEDHDATRRQYGLELIGHNQFETGSGQIFVRPTLSGNNGIQHVDLYQSSYLDRLEKKIESKPLKCVLCGGNHGTSSCPKMWDMMACQANAKGQPGCKWCTKNYTCYECEWYVSGNF